MQAGHDFADVRIPADRPDLNGVISLAGLSATTLHDLARAEGFAGRVMLEGDTCTWHRDVNWHGAPDTPDVGAIRFDEDGHMVESGVLAEYTELWEQRAISTSRAIRIAGGGYRGVCVVSGDTGVMGIGRQNKPATKPLLEALASGRVPKDIELLFDGAHALCRIAGSQAVAVLATNPLAEGAAVLTLGDQSVIWHRTGFDGRRSDIALQIEP